MLPDPDPLRSQFQTSYPDGCKLTDVLDREEAGELLHRWCDDWLQELCHPEP